MYIRVQIESVRVNPGDALDILREGPCAPWSPNMGNEIAKTMPGTTVKASLEKTTIM